MIIARDKIDRREQRIPTEITLTIHHLDTKLFPLIDCYFSVIAKNKLPVTNLRSSHFWLRENKIKQKFELIDHALASFRSNVAILIHSTTKTDKLTANVIRACADHIVNYLNENDQGAVLKFADHVHLEQGFTTNKIKLHVAIHEDPHFDSNKVRIYDAINSTTRLSMKEEGFMSTVILTCGGDSGSHASIEQAITIALTHKNRVHIICLDTTEKYYDILRHIAQSTGGYTYRVSDFESAKSAANRIREAIYSHNILRYKSPSEADEKSRRELIVGVNFGRLSSQSSTSL